MGKIFDRILVVMGAIICMQLPLFMTQYTHQLNGHVEELKWQVEEMERAASRTHKSVDQYIEKFIASEDSDFSTQGLMMEKIVERFEKLSLALQELKLSSLLIRPFIFFRYLQWDIAKATLNNFAMGLSFTTESILYALMGIFIGSSLYQFLKVLFSPRKKIAL